MHLDEGYSNPLANSWYLLSILKGLRRHKGEGIDQKLPITDTILQSILAVLNFSNPFEVTFWTACLVAFFSFFRKSNLLIPSPSQFDPAKHLCISDIQFGTSGAVLSIRWSKTIQYRQKTLCIPLPHIARSPFCPFSALMLCISRIPKQEHPLPLFCFPFPQGPQPITYTMFITHLRLCLRKIGLNPTLYSGHSFPRGGASYALQCGIPAKWKKLQGDWSSDSYQRYLDPSFQLRVRLAQAMGNAFPRPSGEIRYGEADLLNGGRHMSHRLSNLVARTAHYRVFCIICIVCTCIYIYMPISVYFVCLQFA